MSDPKNCGSTMEAKAELQAMGFEPVPVLKAIRTKCLDCSGGMASEVRDCLVRNCALYPFRMGSNPWRAPVSDEHRQRAARIRFAVKNPPDGRGNGATDEAAVGGSPAKHAEPDLMIGTVTPTVPAGWCDGDQ